jgi:hypothetical protein
MDEAKKEELKKEARKLMDDFAKALETVKLKQRKGKSELGGFREKAEMKSDSKFRERMFENAPTKNNDFIVAEKKKW